MQKNSKIYIAGHTGLVGSAIIRSLTKSGFNNLIFSTHKDLDLTRQEDTEAFFNKVKPEYVFLAAARVGGIVANMTYKAEFIYQNLMVATNVIDASYKSGVKKLLNLGSSCIYPAHAPQPMKEEHLLTGALEPTNEPYAIAKIAAIKLCRYFNEQYGTNFISAMPTNLYGINDNFNLETAHVLPALIRKFHLAKLLKQKNFDIIKQDIQKRDLGFKFDNNITMDSEQSITNRLNEIGIFRDHVLLWGTGKPYREFLYADDLADACIFLMEKYNYENISEFINIGSGSDMMIKDIAGMVKEVIGYDGIITHDTSKPDGMVKKLMNNSRIKELGWKQSVEMREGISRTYEWYVQN